MMSVQPETVGVSQESINRVMRTIQKHEINLHSLLMARGNQLFFEKYWAPFDAQKPHRMYSVTKSFTSMAIGCLQDEGRISLDDPIIRYFPDKLPECVHPYLAGQTIRHMLMMSTCFEGSNWFQPEMTDRLRFYFAQKPVRPSGTIFSYDSNGSYVLGALVERVTGKRLIDYLREKVLGRIGGFENAEILKTPDGSSWGDSALLCTPRALMNAAQLMLNGGMWEGEQLISREYVTLATTRQIDNGTDGRAAYDRYGYGYQFWMAEQGGFMMNGMGCQFAVCVPEKQFVFVCTGDTQLHDAQVIPFLFETIFENVVGTTDEETPALCLPVAHGAAHSGFAKEIADAWFACTENPMGITRFRLEFETDATGCFHYWNAQGEKKLRFGMKRNVFGKFPQYGYSREYGNMPGPSGFCYDCAVSAGWVEEKKLLLKVQIIDMHMGNLVITIGFRDRNTAGVRMIKFAENFLNEYEGWLGAARA